MALVEKACPVLVGLHYKYIRTDRSSLCCNVPGIIYCLLFTILSYFPLFLLHIASERHISSKMVQFTTALGLLLSVSTALVSAAPAAAPAPTSAPDLAKRATTCTFSNAASASKSKKSCSTIVLSSVPVPSGTTLDLTGLNSGTHVRLSCTLYSKLHADHLSGHLRGHHYVRLRRMVWTSYLGLRSQYCRHRCEWKCY